MNNIVSKILVVFVLVTGLLGLSSCEDYLDKSPLTEINPEDAYKNFRNFQGFVEELYNGIPIVTGGDWHTNWNFGEDEHWELNEHRLFWYSVEQGDYWAWNTSQWNWFGAGGHISQGDRFSKKHLYGQSWAGIRKANLGIANLDLLTEATDEERKLIEGQLYFFRGWYHFMLMKYWGGLPYIDEAIPADEVFRRARLTYQETADKAAADFQRAADLLPVNWDDTQVGKMTLGNNNMRINKIMALAYKGKNLLYAGSPLMNEVSGNSATYNEEYCKQAAEALAQALKLTEETGRYELAEFEKYSEVFYTHNQGNRVPGLNEAIFQENLIEAASRFRWNQVNDYRPMTLIPSGIKVYPTANYVQYYGMKNGLPLEDEASGWDSKFPWKDRDPRFYHDIIFDGVQVTLQAQPDHTQYASLQTDGRFRKDSGVKAVLTGYMNKKYTNQYLNQWDGYQDGNVMVLSFMRLADVYLLYAEALAMGYGSPTATVPGSGYSINAVDAVNKVRARADVAALNSKYLSNNTEFMKELRRERAVELSFEGHRFNDLRRWKLLLSRPYTQKFAVEFDRVTPNNVLYADPINAEVADFRFTLLAERNLSEKHYWFPFLTSDVNLYPEFKQNPGW